MSGPLAGVRVLEVASHVFVPMAGSVLAEWGAEVIKVEHPVTGDPYRGLSTYGLHNTYHGVDPFFSSANRGKRSVGIDLSKDGGRRVLSRLAADADVFMTNLPAGARTRLRVDAGDLRADNPRAVYVRATAFGSRGPDAASGGYDSGAYWARSGMQHLFTPPDAEWPPKVRPAFGDMAGALAVAGAVSAALYQRSVTGEAPLIDVALLASGLWQIAPDITNAGIGDTHDAAAQPDRHSFWNPLWLTYRTADDRFISFMMLHGDPHWPDLCRRLGRPELGADERFTTGEARKANSKACVEALDALFAAHDYAWFLRALDGFAGEWAPVQAPAELHDDPQVRANGFIAATDVGDGVSLPLVTSPAQFDERPGRPGRAPEAGEHTDDVLLALGLTWDDLLALKEDGSIL